MDLNNQYRHYTKNFSDQTVNGVLGVAGDLVNCSSYSVTQTTANIALTLPAPTVITNTKPRIWVSNPGTASFTLNGYTIDPNTESNQYYDGAAWRLTGSLPYNPDKFPVSGTGAPGGVVPAGSTSYNDFDGSFNANITLPTAVGRRNQVFTVNHNATLNATLLGTNKIPSTSTILSASNRTTQYISDGSNWVSFAGRNFYIGNTTNPTATIPTSTPLSGDTYLVTSDGTTTGTYQLVWYHNGTTWVPGAPGATSITTPVSGIRSYYTATTAYQSYLADPVTGDIAAQGFTLVGGATMVPYGSLFGLAGMWNISSNAATLATAFTIPTQYIRHEVSITAGVSNTYFLRTLGDRETTLEVWVCNAATGVPEKRLAAKAVSSTGAGIKNTVQLSPREEYGCESDYFEWLGFEIPSALVASNKTATNTIKLAFRPGVSNGGNTNIYIGGWAVAANNIGYSFSSGFVFDDIVNGGTQIVFGGTQDNMTYCSISANTTVNGVRVALPDTNKNIYLSLISLGNPGNRAQWLDTTIAHISGNVALGRPRPHLKSPLADNALRDISNNGLPVAGWIIPAATLAAKSVTPTNSGVSYLDLNFINRSSGNIAYITGIIAEQTN